MKWISVGLVLSTFSIAHAQPDAASRNALIEKLNRVYLTIAPEEESRVAVTLRLADLFAERARQDSLQSLDQECLSNCNVGNEDRQKALKLYLEALPKVSIIQKPKVMIQIGHLYEMVGEEAKAEKFYLEIFQTVEDDRAKAEAALSIAEMKFKKRDYTAALKHYDFVERTPVANSRGLAAYRKAWCLLNLRQLSEAVAQLENQLQSKELLSRTGSSATQVDLQFHDEVARDYATFLARQEVTPEKIQMLFNLSPSSTRLGHLTYLALETERVGQKRQSLNLWNFIYEKQNLAPNRLEALTHQAQLNLDLGDKEQSLDIFEKALALQSELKDCQQSECVESAKGLRQFVFSWHRSEKKNTTESLLKAYSLYLAHFSSDAEMYLGAAEVSENIQKWSMAGSYYTKAADLMLKAPEKNNDKIETILLKNIEVAESSKDDAIYDRAADLYLSQSPKQAMVFSVRYQKAYRLYQKSDYAQAVPQLKILALDPAGDMKLRRQAADLAVDALVILKQEPTLQQWAGEFASLFDTSENSDFSHIQQKSILTQVVNLAVTQPQQAETILNQFQPAKASAEDRISFWKNKILLAEKSQNWLEAKKSVDSLLSLPLGEKDQEFALGRKLYFAEMQLDFRTAFQTISKMRLNEMTLEQKNLKLAMYADLAEEPSFKYYEQYLLHSKDEENKKIIAAELVRRSSNPTKELEHRKPVLQKHPEILGEIYSEIYSKTASDKILNQALLELKNPQLISRKILARVSFIKEWKSLQVKMASHQLDSSQQRKLNATIKQRTTMLEKLEQQASKAIQMEDWSCQLLSLDSLAKESNRFYQDLMSLPIPTGLSAEEEQEYLNLLGLQAAPYQQKAQLAKGKVDEFWAQTTWVENLKKTLLDFHEIRNLIVMETEALKSIANEKDQKILGDLLLEQNLKSKKSLQDLEGLRQKVRENPMQVAALQDLLIAEKERGQRVMVEYLEARLHTLQEKKSL